MGKCSDSMVNDNFVKKLKEIKLFADKEVLPKAKAIDLKNEFPYDLCEKMHSLGCFSLLIPKKWGGEGFGIYETAKIIETLSYASASIGLLVICHTTGLLPVLSFGSNEQREKFSKKVTEEKKLFAFALTEAKAGSDASSVKSIAKKLENSEEYLLKGIKVFVTNIGVSDYYTVFAKTEARKGSRGISCFVIEKEMAGVEVTSVEEKIGMRGIPCGNMRLKNVRVNSNFLIGKEGKGFSIALNTLNKSRPFVAFQAIGIARYALKRAIIYAANRKQFGKPIAKHQAVMFKLSKMATNIEAAECLSEKTCKLIDTDHYDKTKFSAMSKALATDVAMETAIDAMQIFGGYSTNRNGDIERLMRDAKITQIFEGSNEIQNLVIGNQLYKEAGILEEHQ